jgi:hypothetical protein
MGLHSLKNRILNLILKIIEYYQNFKVGLGFTTKYYYTKVVINYSNWNYLIYYHIKTFNHIIKILEYFLIAIIEKFIITAIIIITIK